MIQLKLVGPCLQVIHSVWAQGDLTTGGVSIRFVLILLLPYDYFYGAYKSKLIRFHMKIFIKKCNFHFRQLPTKVENFT